MLDKTKEIFIMAVFGIVAIAGAAYVIDIILVRGLQVDTGIISGILGMIGGFAGAMGAYLVAKQQIEKETELYEQRDRERNRPIISCTEFSGSKSLEDLKMKENVRIMQTNYYKNYISNNKFKKVNFMEIKFLGECSFIYDVNIIVMMKKKDKSYEEPIELYLGLMENNLEVYIPLLWQLNDSSYLTSLGKLEMIFKTQKGENMKYVYDMAGQNEEYFLLKGNADYLLLKTIDFESSSWIYPAKKKERD